MKRLTMPLWPDAGQALGLTRSGTYVAAKRGDIPTIRIGRKLLVPIAQFEKLLETPIVPIDHRQQEIEEYQTMEKLRAQRRVDKLIIKRKQLEADNARRLQEIDLELQNLATNGAAEKDATH